MLRCLYAIVLYWRGCGLKLVWAGYYELLNFVCLGIYDVLLVNMNLCEYEYISEYESYRYITYGRLKNSF